MVGVFVYTFLCLQHAFFETKLSKVMTSLPDNLANSSSERRYQFIFHLEYV